MFRSLMVQKNMELQLQALRVIKERNGKLEQCAYCTCRLIKEEKNTSAISGNTVICLCVCRGPARVSDWWCGHDDRAAATRNENPAGGSQVSRTSTLFVSISVLLSFYFFSFTHKHYVIMTGLKILSVKLKLTKAQESAVYHCSPQPFMEHPNISVSL